MFIQTFIILLYYIYLYFSIVVKELFYISVNYFFKAKRKTSLRAFIFTFDEDNLMAIYKEFKNAIDIVK